MAVSEKTKIDADSILCSLSDGTTTLEWDVAGDSQVWFAHGAHTVNKFTSQHIKSQGIVKDGVYDPVTLTVTFLASEATTIEGWWKNGTPLIYEAGEKSYTNCQVRIAEQPTITPGKNDYLTMNLEISCLMNVAGTGT